MALGGEVDNALAVLLDISGFQVLCSKGVADELPLLVEQEELVAVGDQPKLSLSVFRDVMDVLEFVLCRCERYAGMRAFLHQVDAATSRAYQDIAVVQMLDMRNIGALRFTLGIVKLCLGEILVIVNEHASVGTQDDAAMAVLRDAVETVGVRLPVVLLALSHGAEVVTVIDVEPIAGGYPDEAIRVLEYLRGKVARKLVVCIKKPAALRPCGKIA